MHELIDTPNLKQKIEDAESKYNIARNALQRALDKAEAFFKAVKEESTRPLTQDEKREIEEQVKP